MTTNLTTHLAIADRINAMVRNFPISNLHLWISVRIACEQFGFAASDLLNADDETFAHDVSGIIANMNTDRFPPYVDNSFLPRVFDPSKHTAAASASATRRET